MASHKSKVFFTWITIIIAVSIYVMSFYYTGIGGFAVIGTSLQIVDAPIEPENNNSNGGGSGGNLNPEENLSFNGCANKVTLQDKKLTIIDTEKTPVFCLSSQELANEDLYPFAKVNTTRIQSSMQLDVTLYQSVIKKSFFPKYDENIFFDINSKTRVYVRRLTTIAENYSKKDVTFFSGNDLSKSNGLLVLSLDENTVVPQQSNTQTLKNLIDSIVAVKKSLNESNNSDQITEAREFLWQTVRIIELDENETVISRNIINLENLLNYSVDSKTAKLTLQLENKDSKLLVFLRSKENAQLSTLKENATLQDYSEQFLLDTKDSQLIPSELFVLRTVLLSVISVGFLSLHNLSLVKKYPIHVRHL